MVLVLFSNYPQKIVTGRCRKFTNQLQQTVTSDIQLITKCQIRLNSPSFVTQILNHIQHQSWDSLTRCHINDNNMLQKFSYMANKNKQHKKYPTAAISMTDESSRWPITTHNVI